MDNYKLNEATTFYMPQNLNTKQNPNCNGGYLKGMINPYSVRSAVFTVFKLSRTDRLSCEKNLYVCQDRIKVLISNGL